MAEIEKLDLTSMDIKEHQLEKLKELFPEAFTEGNKIDWDRLRRTLGEQIDAGKERYGMNWPGKADCFKTIQQPSIATLVPAREESVEFDTTQNLFIEGDNLEALKLLQKSYLGKVKMIYIDPPYNTGNDFIYPDNYTENLDTYLAYTGQVDAEGRKFSTNTETDGRFHSKWLNMMYPRLSLAKNLLKEDGVIFVSIDDNEVNNLRMLMNEVFGESNLLPPIVRRAKVGGGSDNKQIAREIDYVLGAARNIYALQKFFLPHTEKDLKRYNQQDVKGKYFWDTYSRSGLASDDPESDSLFYEVSFPDGTVRSERWRRSEARLKLDIKEGEAKYVQTQNGWNIHFKQRLNDEGKRPRQVLYDGMGNTEGSEDIESVWPEITFSYPKPTSLIKHLAKICGTENDVIIDFFAGSGTTAHAVLDLNQADAGNRKFIMVQLPEPCDEKSDAFKAGCKTIADIGKERIRRVINKIKKEHSKNPDMFKGDISKLDVGFKVFKLSKSNFNIWDANVEKTPEAIGRQLELHINHISAEASQEAILYELLLKSGFELTTPIERLSLEGQTVFSIADGELLICLDKHLTNEVIKAMAEKKPSRVICLDEGFQDNDQLKTNAVQIMKSKGVVFRTV